MASKSQASAALLVALNLIFFTLVSSTNCPPPPKPSCDPCSHPVKPNPKPSPNPKPKPSPSPKEGSCPRDTLKLRVCANVLNLLRLKIGNPPVAPCCSLLDGLVDLEAAVCLCTTLKASVLGINLNLPVDLSLLLNVCGRKTPKGFQCA